MNARSSLETTRRPHAQVLDAGPRLLGTEAKLGVQKPFVQIKNVRKLGKSDMIRNTALPKITVDPQTFEVEADGVPLVAEPARSVPLARRYFLR